MSIKDYPKRIGIAFTISEDLRRSFKVKTAEQGKKMSEVLRQLIQSYVLKEK